MNLGAKRVAIVYHYLAHYREAVFASLSEPQRRHSYVVFSDRHSNLPGLSTIDPRLARSENAEGTINWRFIRNRWFSQSVLWQSAPLRIALGREFDVLILLGNVHFLSTWVAAMLARLRGKRVLMWTHGVLRREAGLPGRLRRSFYRLAHGLLLYGHRARDILQSQGFNKDSLYVVYNSLNTADQLRALCSFDKAAEAAARKRHGLAAETPFLISIGRMTRGKDLEILPPALAELKARGIHVDVVFVGDGPMRGEMEGLATRHDVRGQMHFLGEIYAEEELCPLIASAAACVCPGSVGLTAMHAMIYGTSVITHDDADNQKPEFEAVIPGISGETFRRGDAADLARVIERFLMRNSDPDLARRQCRENLLRRYSPEVQTRVIEMAVDGRPAAEAFP